MALRTCAECGYASDNLEEFTKDSTKIYGRKNLCKPCGIKRQLQGRKIRQKLVDEFKKHPCAICGVQFPPCAMDFHHSNDDKISGIAKMLRDNVPMPKIYAEIAKCVLVCSNCHRILHCLEEE